MNLLKFQFLLLVVSQPSLIIYWQASLEGFRNIEIDVGLPF